MSLTVINSNWTGAGPRETLTANETVFIGSGLSLISTSGDILQGSASDIAAVVSSGTSLYAINGAINRAIHRVIDRVMRRGNGKRRVPGLVLWVEQFSAQGLDKCRCLHGVSP